MDHQLFADDSQLHRSWQPTDVDQTILSVQDRISDIKDWMTDNKLQINEDKTEALLFNSSKLQDPPSSLSICQTTVTFSDFVRNFGFYLDKDLSMKEHINFICKTAFNNFAVSALFDIIFQLTPLKLLLFHVYSLGLTIATLSQPGSHCPWSQNFKGYKTVQPVL